MAFNPPLGGGMPPDLSQKNPNITKPNPQVVSSQNFKRDAADLQIGNGFTVATNRLESSNAALIIIGTIQKTQPTRDPSPLQTLPPNKVLEPPSVGIENSIRSQIDREHKADGEDNEGIHTDPNLREMAYAHLDNISEQANQLFIDLISTTTTKTLHANLSTKAARQNASTNSTIEIGIQLAEKEKIHVAKSR